MNNEIKALLNAYYQELRSEAETVAAIAEFVAKSSFERKKLLADLAQHFAAGDYSRPVSGAEIDPDGPQKMRSLVSELEKSLHSVATGPLPKPANGQYS